MAGLKTLITIVEDREPTPQAMDTTKPGPFHQDVNQSQAAKEINRNLTAFNDEQMNRMKNIIK